MEYKMSLKKTYRQ